MKSSVELGPLDFMKTFEFRKVDSTIQGLINRAIRAYRAAIVMAWNLSYAHLLNWILRDPSRLALFNTNIIKRNSKKASLVITKYDNFEDLKEREVVDICNIASLFNSSVYKILVGKLDRRNIAAHPSNVVVVQSQADDTITDLVNNVVLGLN